MTKGGKGMERQMTPRQVAEATGMIYQNVCRLMRSGEIESFAVGVDPRSPRPRLATTERAVTRWQLARQEMAQEARRPTKKPVRQHRRAMEEAPEGGYIDQDGKLRIKRR